MARIAERHPTAAAKQRLSSLDGSFLRLESGSAHMHVGWTARMAVPDDRDRPTLAALRQRVADRLEHLAWCRWKLRQAPLRLAEPRWVTDAGFDLAAHVAALSDLDEAVSFGAFARMRDALLSQPLDRTRPLWEIFLVPRLEDGSAALVGKVHHALVDGVAALQMAGLVIDAEMSANSGVPATLPGRERRQAGTDARAVLRAVRADLAPRAPASPLNVPIGPGRTLVGYRFSRPALKAARQQGGTVNDIGLTVVAGALRALVSARGRAPALPWKAMIPVSMRHFTDFGPGNRIAMVFIQLPVHLETPQQRLAWVREQMRELKQSTRATDIEALYRAGGLLPTPLRRPVARAMAGPRIFNLTISNAPGPRESLHVLGCEVSEINAVIPIADRHALAIGMVRYRDELFIGSYADPRALPEIERLPELLAAEVEALAGRQADVSRR
jgi:WS/DGAT/MGAT family acyltransferase